MASPLTHAVVALSLGTAWKQPGRSWAFLAWGVLCAEVPDADVMGFWFGIPYGDLWGHRGLTHSLLFATLFAAVPTYALAAKSDGSGRRWVRWWLYFFLATASHGICDALTDGGLGVAFLAPFDATRYFFAFRPIRVSPLELETFLSPVGLRVLVSEAFWIWLPCAVFSAVFLARHALMWTQPKDQ